MLLQHPHDHFVREFLSDVRHAREFLSAVMPAELSARFDWTQLRGEPATFIDQNLRDQYSDLLFSIVERNGEPTQVYLLFEHKSALDPWLLRQLLGYLARIYAAQTKPAPVIPLVFYHGAAPHPAQRRLIEELGLSPDRRTCYQVYIAEFSYLLFDLAHAAPRAWESLAVRVFLAALDSVLRQDLARMVDVLRLADQLLREPESTKIVHALLVYLFHVTELEPAQWQTLLTSPLSSKMEATMISAAQKLFERGFNEGKQEALNAAKKLYEQEKEKGRLEGESLILERLLLAKFGAVPPVYRQRIKQANAQTLLIWSERVLTAATLDEVFGK